MEEHWLSRTELLIGKEGVIRLSCAHILVVGLGGVGAYAAEQLVRAGVGTLTLVDGDYVHQTNRNRQLPALLSTEGRLKTEVLAERFREINPKIQLNLISEFVRDERIQEVLEQSDYDYIVDAIDTLSPKVFLIYRSIGRRLKLVSSMGSGGKTDPTQVRIDDISKTINCPMARALRKRLNRLGIRNGFKAVFSPEAVPREAVIQVESEQNKKSNVGTISYMPPLFGTIMASEIIRSLLRE